MEFEIGKAILAGLAATVAMTVAMMAGSAMMGMKMDVPMTLGTMFIPKGRSAKILGTVVHLINGIIFFVVYAALFKASGIGSNLAAWGVLFGLVHGVIAGLLFGLVPMMHPRLAEEPNANVPEGQVPAPGFFALNFGMMAAAAVLMVHIIFGVVGTAVYAI